MDTNRVILVSWSPKTAGVPVLLENLFLESKRLGLYDPFIIEGDTAIASSFSLPINKAGEGVSRFFKTYGSEEIPIVPRESFHSSLNELAKKQQTRLLKGKDFFLVAGSADLKPWVRLTQTVWVFLTPDTLNASYLYNLIGLFKGNSEVTLYIWIVGVPSFELAAEKFLKIKEELISLRRDYFTLNFAGSCSIDETRLGIARAFQMPLIDAFPADSFHGSLKYGLKRTVLPSDPSTTINFLDLRKEFGVLSSTVLE